MFMFDLDYGESGNIPEACAIDDLFERNGIHHCINAANGTLKARVISICSIWRSIMIAKDEILKRFELPGAAHKRGLPKLVGDLRTPNHLRRTIFENS